MELVLVVKMCQSMKVDTLHEYSDSAIVWVEKIIDLSLYCCCNKYVEFLHLHDVEVIYSDGFEVECNFGLSLKFVVFIYFVFKKRNYRLEVDYIASRTESCSLHLNTYLLETFCIYSFALSIFHVFRNL